MNGRTFYQSNFSENLHSDNSVNKEEHDDQQSDVRQRLETFDESPEKRSNTLASTEQFHQTHHTEQAEEVNAYYASACFWSGANRNLKIVQL